MLSARGHDVHHLEADNDHIDSIFAKLSASVSCFYSAKHHRMMLDSIAKAKPDVVHVHNFFPTLSPSVFRACTESHVPVVHTIHNYRLLCAGATFFRNGAVCEDCVETNSFFPAVRHSCYRSNRIGSIVVGGQDLQRIDGLARGRLACRRILR